MDPTPAKRQASSEIASFNLTQTCSVTPRGIYELSFYTIAVSGGPNEPTPDCFVKTCVISAPIGACSADWARLTSTWKRDSYNLQVEEEQSIDVTMRIIWLSPAYVGVDDVAMNNAVPSMSSHNPCSASDRKGMWTKDIVAETTMRAPPALTNETGLESDHCETRTVTRKTTTVTQTFTEYHGCC